MSDSPKILVVDDEAHIRAALTAALESEGYQVLSAVNGKDAVEKCRQWHPALVLLDVRMPILDGHMCSIEIKYDESLKDIKIIFLTANADEDSKNLGLGHGAEMYLTKPFNVQELLHKINTLLDPYGQKKLKKENDPVVQAPQIDAEQKARYLENLRKKMGR
jgi:DNA-binding response OmpR family regulator